MRALPLDFPGDAMVADLRDEYMFGPAFLVAPVTEQGATSRKVYLPAGADWYNYWTNERMKGGQTVDVASPIETIPGFVRAGSIVPLGWKVESTHEKQAIKKVRVYPGANGEFTLFSDDGTTYAYEKGAGSVTRLHWDDAQKKLTHDGAAAWSGADSETIELVGQR
jgi:alpha-glucosidase (family GH31 glycosyl hydrolase)